MPKILINEIDKTNPGTPGGYSNYSVLIPGFMGNGDSTTIAPDSNGIYEFRAVQDFIDTIGLVAPKATASIEVGEGEEASAVTQELYHYGNQMAYELLKQGYSILYMPITPDNCIDVLSNANTWEIFKDKANYDFRFVTHGLLESSDTSTLEAEEKMLDEALQTLNNKNVITYNADSMTVTIGGKDLQIGQLTNADLERVNSSNEAYQELYNELISEDSELVVEGLIDPDTKEYYASSVSAVTGVLKRMRTVLSLLAACITDVTINTVNNNIANLAKYVKESDTVGIPGRGDCVALIELDENVYADSTTNPEIAIIRAVNAMSGIDAACGKYCALTVPSVVYNMIPEDEFDGNKKFPGAFHYLACFMNALRSGFAEWYAAAGYTRGVSSYKVDHTTVTLGEIAINALEPRNTDGSEDSPKFACNVIANFRGSYYLWGNRTAHPLGDVKGNNGDLVASHFLNIRQLCTTIKKQLYVACRRFTFDPNSDTLWFNFVNAIRPTLEAMKADQGVRDYKILKVYTDKKATLKAKIRIIPIEAVEDFDLEVSLEDSFGETAAVVTE
jgi:hypothetical protein